MVRVARAGAEPPIDLAANERRIEGDRAAIAAALADLVRERPAHVVDGTPEDILENDRRQAAERAKLEQCDARLVEAKRVVAAANRNLPPGCARVVDPEGPLVDGGKPSILDQVRIPITGVAGQ